MSDSKVVHSTFVLERNYPQAPAKVYAAFALPERKRKWFAEGDHEIQQYELDFRVGGAETLIYTFKPGHPIAGVVLSNTGLYQDIVPEKRIVVAMKMSLGDKPLSATLLTIELVPNGAGTDLICTHQGAFLEWAEGPQMIEMGWKSLLEKVAAELGRE